MKDLLYAVVGLIAAAVAVWEIYTFLQPLPKGTTQINYVPVIIGIICAVVALICGALFLSGRVNKSEEIHVTE